MKVSHRARRRTRVSFRKKLLFSVVTTLLFFAVLEGVLALLGVAPESKTKDPFVGFSGLMPLMELSTNDRGEQFFTTSQNKLHWFNAQTFKKVKSKGTKRIFCMGGSTTYGHPYWDSTSFSGWMREFLPIVDASRKWEVINAGGISYASYRVAALMEELVQYEPDVFVIYSVHNEFLERRTYQNMFETSMLQLHTQAVFARTRVWSLANRILKPTSESILPNIDVLNGEVNEILNHTVGPVDYHRDVDWRSKVILHYETNLRRMVAIARQAGAKIVFITPTSNEKDCSPFKSEHGQNMSSEQMDQLLDIVRQSESPEIVADRKTQVTVLESLTQLDPTYADYHYRLGQAYFAIDRHADAKLAFSRAINEDVCPLRAIDEIRNSIDRVAHELRVPVVDFEQHLRHLSDVEYGHTILGESYFLDHVHPTIEVNWQLALWIIDKLQTESIVAGKRVSDVSIADEFINAEKRVLSTVDRGSQAFALRNLAKVLHWAGKFEEAIPRARDVLNIIPDDQESRFILARCLSNLGRKEDAIQEYRNLFASGVDYPRAHMHFGELLAETGSMEQAKAYLLMAVLHDPKNARAFYLLGLVHLDLREFEFAAESFEESKRLVVDNSQTLFYLAKAKVALGKHIEANSLFSKVIALGSRDANIHYQYGLSLWETNEKAEAKRQFEKALEIDPDWIDAKDMLELASKIN